MHSDVEGKKGPTGLSSCTYLNIRTAKALCPKWEDNGSKQKDVLFQQVPVRELKAEIEAIAEQMSYAPFDDYAYLKGQYVALYRVLNPGSLEATAQVRAVNAARVWGRGLHRPVRKSEDQKPMTDNQYLEFCGVDHLGQDWQVKYRGIVTYGDLVWCWVCEQWEPASGSEIGQKVTEYFTAELTGERGE